MIMEETRDGVFHDGGEAPLYKYWNSGTRVQHAACPQRVVVVLMYGDHLSAALNVNTGLAR